MTAPGALLGRRAWRRLERLALRGYQRDLLHRMEELVAPAPRVVAATGSWDPGALSLQMSGRRLLLGGISPAAVWDVMAMANRAVPLRLVGGGRYGSLWWIRVVGDERRVVLGTHLRLVEDGGGTHRPVRDLPLLSGAY